MTYELPGTNEVSERIGSYTQSPESETLRQEVNELLSSYSNLSDPVERQSISDALRDSGTLPSLALVESPRLDVLGDSDGVTMDDLDHILSDPDHFDPTTRLAADYVKENFARIEESTTDLWGWDTIENNEFEAYKEYYQPGDAEAAATLTPWDTDGDSTSDNDDQSVPREVGEMVDDLDELLASSSPDAQKVFQILEQLAASGTTEITLHDKDGNEFTGRIAMEAIAPGSDRSYLHLFVPDASGAERIALRAVAQRGAYSQQYDSNGMPVSFLGTKFGESGRINASF
ncbi:MAG: hypothetical protein IT342_24110 [Candidatus Melainabacteria bacterium]|nr:hypothetical protein [Candidatus Melainabacteria bacterium]